MKKTTLKNKVMSYNIAILIIIGCLLGMILFTQIKAERFYNQSIAQYTYLGNFYNDLKLANENICGLFYTGQQESYTQYMEAILRAEEDLKKIQEGTNNKEVYRKVKLLRNMLNTYKEWVDTGMAELVEEDSLSQATYIKINRVWELVMNTSSEYFMLLTAEMDSSKENIVQSWKIEYQVFLIVILTVLFIAVVLSFNYLKQINTPITMLIKNIEGIKQGRYKFKEIKVKIKELSILIEAFQQMGVSIEKHISTLQEKNILEKRLLEKQNENLKIRQLLAETEIKSLQAHINPHFLFNTLGMISGLAYMENAYETNELIDVTAQLLRYGIDKSAQMASLALEIECIKNYISIQKKRNGERICFELRVEEDLPNLSMPGMILQPIIENSIQHGVKDMASQAKITITIFKAEDKVEITIEDNGRGMNEGMLRRLQEREEESEQGIGIYNVKRRLEIYYGESAFRIWSKEGEGTKTYIQVSQIKEGGK